MIRQLIREMLLTERVYGAQAVVYHGSKAPPDVFVPALLNDTFEPGMGDGAMYGKALYCVYDLGGTKTEKGDYGKYIYKFKVNLYGFICFDPDVAQLVYKRPLTPVEQAQELGLDETLTEKLERIRVKGIKHTSDAALPASEFLKGKVKGLIFTGSRDGRVAVIYDQTVAVPFAWKKVGDKSWTAIDKSSLKPALRRSASGDWEAEKYDINQMDVLAKLSKLPVDKRMVKGKLDLSNNAMITSLPAGLQVGGDLDLTDTGITSLPAGLRVGGSLDISGIGITSLPAGLRVGGGLNISATGITSLPSGLRVGGGLNISRTGITSLPVDLQVGGELDLSRTGITSLPAGLKVGGSLDIDGSSIASLPAGLQVGLNLNLGSTLITSLPAGLQVGGNLSLRFTKITSLPADLQVGGYFNLSYTKIASLPAGLNVGGTLDIEGTRITLLPAGLKVGRNLTLRGSGVTSLPVDLQVGYDIIGFGGDKSQVPQHLKDKLK